MIIQPFNDQQAKVFDAIASGYARLHFSQIGEDCLIWNLCNNVEKGFYVDIGCHHPFRYSNTALLSIFKGWTGLNVDADRRAIELFEQYRPQDINVRCAVGNTAGSAEVFLFKDPAVNTLDPAWADRQIKDYGEPQKERVEILPLRELLDRYLPALAAIDVLNIDIEGLDQQAIESNDWQKYRPKLVCIEAHGMNINQPADSETFQYMHRVGYHMIAHIYATSIFRPNS